MSFPYLIKPDARSDLDRAYRWYEAQQAGRGYDFLVEFRDRLSEVCQTPFQYGRVRGRTRAAPLPYSHYIIYYRVEPNLVTVLAVAHSRANPRTWQRRK
ncbi:MAG: type II toxin-antitoxin system RelE/ParE family toxin [Gemmataceae bacterium]|nr:type II toxin-antitoxin system RelE/ParE family toxin [Gemmataceae bacterium]